MKLINRLDRWMLPGNSDYRLNHTMAVNLYYPTGNVHLPHRRIVSFSAHRDFLIIVHYEHSDLLAYLLKNPVKKHCVIPLTSGVRSSEVNFTKNYTLLYLLPFHLLRSSITVREFVTFGFKIRYRHYILHRSTKLHPNRATGGGDNDVISIFKMTAAGAQFYFRIPISDWVTFFSSKGQCLMSISKPNFVGITQFTVEIWLFPVWKNKRPPYWNSSYGFDFDHIAVSGMLFCVRLPNFSQIGPS